MTTDVSHRASPEDDKEGLPHPKKPPLGDGSGPGAEPGGKAGPLNHRPMAMDAGEGADQAGERKDKESPRAGPAEPMDTCDATARGADPERGPPPLQPGCPPRDRGPESRPTELSLEELSISARPPGPPALAPPTATPTPGPRPGTHPEEAPLRPSRKRKPLEDTESGKTLLLDAYRVWQQGQKGVACDLGRIERIMSETYMLIKQVGGLRRAPGGLGVHVRWRPAVPDGAILGAPQVGVWSSLEAPWVGVIIPHQAPPVGVQSFQEAPQVGVQSSPATPRCPTLNPREVQICYCCCC